MGMKTTMVTGSGSLTDEEKAWLREAEKREGFTQLAERIGVHREALARAVAGFGCRRGTIALIRNGMKG